MGIQDYDTMCWEDNLINKSTLEYYREGKKEIGYESCYRNNMNSLFLARARINSLKLEEAIGRGKDWYNKNCKLCGLGTENLLHFIIQCPALKRKRNYKLLDKKETNPRQKLIRFLFDKGKYQEKGEMIKNLWYERKAILKKKEEIRLNPEKIEIAINPGRSDPGKETEYKPKGGRESEIKMMEGKRKS